MLCNFIYRKFKSGKLIYVSSHFYPWCRQQQLGAGSGVFELLVSFFIWVLVVTRVCSACEHSNLCHYDLCISFPPNTFPSCTTRESSSAGLQRSKNLHLINKLPKSFTEYFGKDFGIPQLFFQSSLNDYVTLVSGTPKVHFSPHNPGVPNSLQPVLTAGGEQLSSPKLVPGAKKTGDR